jgi:heme oxygenase (biliverdin-producing, ferredoxin)
MPTSFSANLRTEVTMAHFSSAGNGFLSELAAGRLGLDWYALLATQYYPVYAALAETGTVLAADKVASRFMDPALDRTAALAEDLRNLLGPGWRDQVAPSPATLRYRDRILACRYWPGGFVAHHYTRYLGDLSGCRLIGASIARTHGMRPSFFDFGGLDFGGLGSLGAYQERYRARLDAVPWSAAERGRVLREARVARRLNDDLLAEVSPLVLSTVQA